MNNSAVHGGHVKKTTRPSLGIFSCLDDPPLLGSSHNRWKPEHRGQRKGRLPVVYFVIILWLFPFGIATVQVFSAIELF